MSITFRDPSDLATVLSTFKILGSPDRHGFALLQPPTLNVNRFYYWSLNQESHFIGGTGARPIMVDAWITDASFTSRTLIDAYLLELDQKPGDSNYQGVLRIEKDGITQDFENCYFVGARRIPEMPAPLYNPMGTASAGPGCDYWLSVMLEFTQTTVNT